MPLTFFCLPLAFACVIRLISGLQNPEQDLFTESLMYVGTALWSCAIWLLIDIVA